MVKRPYIVGLSVPGYLHQKDGLPCQDACAYKIHNEKWCFIAVADGLGSAPLSHIGSKLAVESAINIASTLISSNPMILPEIPIKMIEGAKLCLLRKADEEGVKISDLATTLIAVAFDKDNLHSAQIGDGAIVIQSEGLLQLISYSLHSEYANEVTPITNEDFLEYLIEGNRVDSKIDCLAVFTDGCQRASLKKVVDGYMPFEGFFKPVFNFASNITDIEKGNREIEEFLLSQKMTEHSEDDKTIVLAVM